MTADGTVGRELPGAAAPGVRHARVPAVRARRPVWSAGTGSRRPSGRERAVPRAVSRSVWVYGAAFAGAVTLQVLWSGRTGGLPSFDRAVHDLLAPGGAPPDWAGDLGQAGALLGYPVLWMPAVAVLVWTARWRHLLVYAGSITAVAAAAQLATGESDLHRLLREGVTGSPGELSLTAWPVIVLAAIATADLLALTPSGPLRRCGWVCVVLVVGGLAAVRVALGVDTASNAVVGAVLGCSAAGLLFGLLAPEDRFPVTYRREDKAHLELDDERSARVRRVVRDQLGLELAEIEPFRLDGSAGSTPCRLRLAAGPPEYLFGKLYATPHLRSDRWYKLARVLRYGRLEDEAPFASVRQLIQHEDYMLRLMHDGGVQVPEPVGVVEVLPGREYLLVTELVPDTVEVLDSGVPDAVVDDALRQVLRLWAAGVAHRDLKPSNVLVQGDRVVLVDVSYGELRPSRWRQAADLANMLLTLAVVAGVPRVLERARAFFDDDELAEAFAASGSLTVPHQLAQRLDEVDGDLLEEFRSLLPPCPRIRVQRWSPRRVLLTLATVGGAVLAVVLLGLNLRAGGLL